MLTTRSSKQAQSAPTSPARAGARMMIDEHNNSTPLIPPFELLNNEKNKRTPRRRLKKFLEKATLQENETISNTVPKSNVQRNLFQVVVRLLFYKNEPFGSYLIFAFIDIQHFQYRQTKRERSFLPFRNVLAECCDIFRIFGKKNAVVISHHFRIFLAPSRWVRFLAS